MYLYNRKVSNTLTMKLLELLMSACFLVGLSSCKEETHHVEIVSSTIDKHWQTIFNREIPHLDLIVTIGVDDSILVIDPQA